MNRVNLKKRETCGFYAHRSEDICHKSKQNLQVEKASAMAHNICYSVYPNREDFKASNIVSLMVVNILISLLSISANSFLIYAIIKTRQTDRISSQFILCLSVSDCCVGIILQPIVILLLTDFAEVHNCALELTAQFLSYTFPQISGVMIVIIAFDRFLHMKYLNQYSTYMTKRRGGLLVAINVMLAFFIASCSLAASLHGKFFIFNTVLVGIEVSVAIVCIVIYMFTYRIVHQQTDQMRKEQLNMKILSPDASKNVPKQDLKLAKTLVFVLTVYSICYLPYLILGLVWSYYQYYKGDQVSQTLEILVWWSFILVYLNSSFNAIIFSARNKHILRLLRKVLCKARGTDLDQQTSEIRLTSDG